MAFTQRLRRLEERHCSGNADDPFFLVIRLVAPGPDGPVDQGIHYCVVINPPGHGRIDRNDGETEDAFMARVRAITGIDIESESVGNGSNSRRPETSKQGSTGNHRADDSMK